VGYAARVNPFTTMLSPVRWGLTAGPNGVAFCRFAWVDPATGQCSNVYQAGAALGIVLPQYARVARNGWNVAFQNWPDPTLILRSGMMVDLMTQGNIWLRFAGGATIGASVYANQIDGTASIIGGAFFSSTPWRVLSYASPGCRALVSSWYTQPS
jgi:hypothetical protein